MFLFSILEQPIVNLSILKMVNLLDMLLLSSCFQIVNLGMSFIILNYIQLVNQSSSAVAGLLVFPGAIIDACFAPFGRILDRLRRKTDYLWSKYACSCSLSFSVFGRHLSNTIG